MNPLTTLATMVNAVEKLYVLPDNELANNPKLVEEIKNAFSVHNIDGFLNAIQNEMAEARNVQAYTPRPDTSQLLNAYAEREHDRASRSSGIPYVTEIINEADQEILKGGKIGKPGRNADKKFSSVFNSVYSDGAVKINTPSDPSTLMSYIDYSPYRVNYAEYLSVPTLSELVDRPLSIALKKFPKVKSDNKEFNKAINKAIEKKKIKSVVEDALFYSLLSPRGSLVVPIKRGDTVTFNSFNDTQFSYGMGSSYSGVTQPYMDVKVGDLYCMGAKLKHGVSAFFTCPGYEPLFGVGLNRVPQLRTAAEAWNLYIHILKILLVRAQVIIQKMEGDIQTDTMLSKMRAQLDRLSQTMGVSTPIEQARGQALDIMNNNIGPGTSDISPVIQSFVSSVTGISPEYFFGGGNATYSQAAFQIHATNENVHSRYQKKEIEPLMRFIVNTLIRYDETIAAFKVSEDEFEIEFESIYEETAQEKAELNSKRTETLIRQASYPELEEEFKREGLLAEHVKLPVIERGIEDEDTDPVDGGNNGGGVLTGALNSKKIQYRLRFPDGKLYGTGSSEGSFWDTPQKALEAKKKSGIRDLMIYEYDTQLGSFVGEVMIS
jgi:hypothetical protein